MSNLKLSRLEEEKSQTMFFSKSITIDQEELSNVALAARTASASAFELEFIEKLKSGDAHAFDVLVTRYANDVYGLLLKITGDVKEAEDLMQETFLSALKAIQKFRGDSELKTWLFRIAINKSKNRFRWWKRRKRESTVSLDAPFGESETPMSETVESGSLNPEETILQKERENILNGALKTLPEIFRQAVILCDIQGLSYEEIAAVLEINLGTVKSRIARGRRNYENR